MKLKIYRMTHTTGYGYCVSPYTCHTVVKVKDLRTWIKDKQTYRVPYEIVEELLALLSDRVPVTFKTISGKETTFMVRKSKEASRK